MKKNWIYYMQEGLKSMWRKKEEKEYPFVFPYSGIDLVEEKEEMELQKELMKCGCKPDCGCKE